MPLYSIFSSIKGLSILPFISRMNCKILYENFLRKFYLRIMAIDRYVYKMYYARHEI